MQCITMHHLAEERGILDLDLNADRLVVPFTNVLKRSEAERATSNSPFPSFPSCRCRRRLDDRLLVYLFLSPTDPGALRIISFGDDTTTTATYARSGPRDTPSSLRQGAYEWCQWGGKQALCSMGHGSNVRLLNMLAYTHV